MISIDVRFVGRNGSTEMLPDMPDRPQAHALVEQFIRFNTMNRPGYTFTTQIMNSDVIQVLYQEDVNNNQRTLNAKLYCVIYMHFEEGDLDRESQVSETNESQKKGFALTFENVGRR